MTLEELRRLQAAGPELAANSGDACECVEWISAIGRGHFVGCANRGRLDTRRRMGPNEVVAAILAVAP